MLRSRLDFVDSTAPEFFPLIVPEELLAEQKRTEQLFNTVWWAIAVRLAAGRRIVIS